MSKERTIFSLLLASIVVASLILASCAPGPPPTATEPPPPEGASPTPTLKAPAPATATPSAPEEAERPLIVAIEGDPPQFDPASAVTLPALTVVRHTYSQLLRFERVAADGAYYMDRATVEPYLAESYEVSDDGLTYTFILREGIEFPSGNPLTTSDVLFSLQRNWGLKDNSYWSSCTIGTICEEDQVEVVDDYTIRLHIPQPNHLLPLIFALPNSMVIQDEDLVKEHATDDDPWATEWIQSHPGGVGPYILEEHVVGQELRFKRNPDWIEPPAFDMTWKIVPAAEARAILLAKGDVDVAEALPFRLVLGLEGTEGISVHRFPSTVYHGLALNHAIPPLDDLRVRQAFAYMIPRERIIDEVYQGMGRPNNGVVSIDCHGFDDSCNEYYYDLDKAKALLAEAGYPDGFSINLYRTDEYPLYTHAFELIQEAAAEIGVEININVLVASVFWDRLYTSMDFPLARVDGESWIQDAAFDIALFNTSWAIANTYNYSNPEVDRLVEEALVVGEPERSDLVSEAQCLMLKDVAHIPWGQPDHLVAMRDTVKGFLFPGDVLHAYYLITEK